VTCGYELSGEEKLQDEGKEEEGSSKFNLGILLLILGKKRLMERKATKQGPEGPECGGRGGKRRRTGF